MGKESSMADRSHLDILGQGVEAWNEWREQNPSIMPDLSRADLSEADLSGAGPDGDMAGPGGFVAGADLSGVDLSRADLSHAFLSRGSLYMTLYKANLTEADLSGANLTEADLSWADLTGTTNLTQKQVERADGDEQTKLPDHLKRPADWSRSSSEQPNRDE
jgi:hypothetical protein